MPNYLVIESRLDDNDFGWCTASGCGDAARAGAIYDRSELERSARESVHRELAYL